MNKTKKKFPWLAVGMTLYALIFLAAASFGLSWFWRYIEAYENSRPLTTMKAFMAQLDVSAIPDTATNVYDAVDPYLQSNAESRAYVANTLSGGISYARRLSECTDQQTVYTLQSGGKTIGKVTLTAQETDEFGFTPWVVTDVSYDFSHLLKYITTDSITVPHDYTVYLNGVLLTADYITEDHIEYDLLADFYDDYDLPYLVTYHSGPVLGESVLTVRDAAGNDVVINEEADRSEYLHNCTESEITGLDEIVNSFISSYVDFSSRKGGDSYTNYNTLCKYMVKNGSLAKRMKEAIAGLSWVTDRNAELTALQINHYVNIGGGRYLCDVAYEVDTRNYSGSIHVTNHAKLIILETDSGLRVEVMASY